MRHPRIWLVAGVLLAMPLVGQVQQVPGESTKNEPAAIAKLQDLMKAQTGAIQTLRARVADLEARVKKLEGDSSGDRPR